MSTISAPHTLHTCVKYRETHGKKDLKTCMEKAVDKLIHQRLAEDRYFAYPLHVGLTPIVARKGNRLAFAQGNRIFLYDLIFRRMMWSCEVPIREEHHIYQLSIFDKDKIRFFTEDKSPSAIHSDIEIRALSAGEVIGSTTLEKQFVSRYSSRFLVHKLQLFKLGPKSITVIDLKSGETSSIPFEGINGHKRATSHLNRNFYVFTTTNDPQQKIPARVFVFDRITEQKKIFDIGFSDLHIDLPSSHIHKNHLFCGMYYKNFRPLQVLSQHIVVMNLVTGEIVKRYVPEQTKGGIKRCIANDNWIVYIVSDSPNNDLWCVDRHTDEQKRISTYSSRIYDDIKLSFSGNLLNISHTTDRQQYFQVIDLTTKDTIAHVSFQHKITNVVQFEEGKLVIFNPNDLNRPTFYIEDYLNPDGDPSQRASAEMIAQRIRK
jgi:hypothetical protein